MTYSIKKKWNSSSGMSAVKSLFIVHYPANTYPNQPKPLADNTHFNPYGGWEIAKMIVMGLKKMNSPLAGYLRTDWQDFDPSHPDNPDEFVWYPSGIMDVTKPDGN